MTREPRELLVALSEVQRIVLGEAAELRTALGQVRGVLAHAVETLQASFLKFEYERTSRPAPSPPTAPLDSRGSDGALHGVAARAIMSLQFEDIARQQLEYADARLAGVEQLARHVDDLCRLLQTPARKQGARGAHVIEELAREIAAGVAQWVEERARRSTKQDSIDAGTTELF